MTAPPLVPTAAALLLGLGTIGWGCWDPTPEPPYGVGRTDASVEETGETGDTGDTTP